MIGALLVLAVAFYKPGGEADPPFALAGFSFFGFGFGFGEVVGATLDWTDGPLSTDGEFFFCDVPFAGLPFYCPLAEELFPPFGRRSHSAERAPADTGVSALER